MEGCTTIGVGVFHAHVYNYESGCVGTSAVARPADVGEQAIVGLVACSKCRKGILYRARHRNGNLCSVGEENGSAGKASRQQDSCKKHLLHKGRFFRFDEWINTTKISCA